MGSDKIDRIGKESKTLDRIFVARYALLSQDGIRICILSERIQERRLRTCRFSGWLEKSDFGVTNGTRRKCFNYKKWER